MSKTCRKSCERRQLCFCQDKWQKIVFVLFAVSYYIKSKHTAVPRLMVEWTGNSERMALFNNEADSRDLDQMSNFQLHSHRAVSD